MMHVAKSEEEELRSELLDSIKLKGEILEAIMSNAKSKDDLILAETVDIEQIIEGKGSNLERIRFRRYVKSLKENSQTASMASHVPEQEAEIKTEEVPYLQPFAKRQRFQEEESSTRRKVHVLLEELRYDVLSMDQKAPYKTAGLIASHLEKDIKIATEYLGQTKDLSAFMLALALAKRFAPTNEANFFHVCSAALKRGTMANCTHFTNRDIKRRNAKKTLTKLLEHYNKDWPNFFCDEVIKSIYALHKNDSHDAATHNDKNPLPGTILWWDPNSGQGEVSIMTTNDEELRLIFLDQHRKNQRLWDLDIVQVYLTAQEPIAVQKLELQHKAKRTLGRILQIDFQTGYGLLETTLDHGASTKMRFHTGHSEPDIVPMLAPNVYVQFQPSFQHPNVTEDQEVLAIDLSLASAPHSSVTHPSNLPLAYLPTTTTLKQQSNAFT